MEALVEQTQPNNPPKITGDSGPGTAFGVVGMPSNESDTPPVQAIGKSKKRFQVSGVASLAQRVVDMYVE